MIDWKQVLNDKHRSLVTLALCGAVALSLQGCIELAVGGAVAAGAFSATDRRTISAQAEDKVIVAKGGSRIGVVMAPGGHVNINSFNRKVLLTGEVRDEQTKAIVEKEAAAIEGVQSVVNELDIGAPAGFSSRTSDTIITGKVKAALVDSKDIASNLFKVVTERGIVYLMGRVTQFEGKVAGVAASEVAGVTKVVKVFEYIDEGTAKQESATPAPAEK